MLFSAFSCFLLLRKLINKILALLGAHKLEILFFEIAAIL